MKKINVSDLADYEGKILARDVFYNGQLLFQSNSIIDRTTINRLSNELKNSIYYVFVYTNDNELKDNIASIISDEILESIKCETELIFHRYSSGKNENHIVDDENDKELVRKIVDIFMNDILEEKYFKNYLENLLIMSPKLFAHSIRVTIVSLILAIKANLNKDLIHGIAIGGVLHEIGRNKLFIEFPILATEGHIYNREEYHLIEMVPVLGFNEVLNNKLIPLVSKKIILLQNVWEDFDSSYDESKKMHMSHPLFYENKKISKEQKDIAVNIVQAANYYDMFMIHFKHVFPSIGSNKEINKFFLKQSDHIFSKEVSNLLVKHISYFTIGEKIQLSNGKIGRVCQHTEDPLLPIIQLNDGTTIDLSKNHKNVYIKNIIPEDKGCDNKHDGEFKKYCNNL